MAKDPAFLFYSSDFLAGVSDLTMEERGQYITLLCLQHQKGHLSKKIIGITVANAAADVLAKFKIDEDGLYYHPRLELEAQKRLDHAEKQRQRAIDGWKKRKEESSTKKEPTANAAALPLENENVNEDENKDGIEDLKKIPSIEIFVDYAFEKAQSLNLEVDEQKVRLKYESWKANGWKTLGDKQRKIQNWKATLTNSLNYLQKEKSSAQKESGTVESIRERLRSEGVEI